MGEEITQEELTTFMIKELRFGKKLNILQGAAGFLLTTIYTVPLVYAANIGGSLISAGVVFASLQIIGRSCDKYDQCSRALRQLTDKQKPVVKSYKK